MSILPYSGLSFFIGFLGLISILFVLKEKLRGIIIYKDLIFYITIFYTLLFLTFSTSIAVILFLLYTYSIYYLATKLDLKNSLWFSLIIALPMILFKLDIEPLYKVLGISYITFRTIQAIIDYKNYGKLSFIEFTSFILFPPTLLAGPIDRSYRFKKDLDSGYNNLTKDNLISGWDILILGILFKFVFAEFINLFWLSKIDANSTILIDMINSAYAYSTYLFFDFAGYSAMAVGIGKMLGIDVPINFNHPYLAQNPQDFWRRFHITLGSWLTDYFFKPIYKYLHGFKLLKGKRLLIQNISIITTFLLMGMWNGLTWYYIFSGFLFGIYSATHNTYVVYVKKGGYDYFTKFPNLVSINVKRLLMLNGAILALYFFSGRVPI